jgi:hypothetical protein
MLSPGVLTATVPLSPRNIHAILASLVTLLGEQAALPKEAQDRRIHDLSTTLMERIRAGDLGVKSDSTMDQEHLEHNAEIAFLRGLIECLRLRDQTTVHFLLHDLLPVSAEPIFSSGSNYTAYIKYAFSRRLTASHDDMNRYIGWSRTPDTRSLWTALFAFLVKWQASLS